MMVLVVAVVGCFSKPATVAPVLPERKNEEKTPSPLVTVSPIQEAKTSPTSEENSPHVSQPIIEAISADVNLADIRIGNPALESSVYFTADRAGTVRIRSQTTDGLRFFRVRTDQFGQTELVGGINGVEVAIPDAGTYKVTGKEKPPSFMDVPLGGSAPSQATNYRVQSVGDCQPPEEVEHVYSIGGWRGTTTRTIKSPAFPADKRILVWLHRGAGNSDDLRDNFVPWVEYLKNNYPRRDELASLVKEYVPDYWDSGPAPNIGATSFRVRQADCRGTGYRSVSVCHSAGCLKALLAGLDLGLVAVAPAFGGSHLATDKLTDAALS
ncbi:MAG: hypothetical protein AAB855_02265, partial [Patescibacteria group bacterium]